MMKSFYILILSSSTRKSFTPIKFSRIGYSIKTGYSAKHSSKKHCYKNLFWWDSDKEFAKHIASSVIYNKDGLIAINKPFGIKINSHNKPGARTEPGKHKLVPMLPECDFTIEDCLPFLEKHWDVYNLRILKSAEKYTSGVVLLGTNDDVAAKVRQSFEAAKRQKIPHLVHRMITFGVPVRRERTERVGIKLLEDEKENIKQPVILMEFSKTSVKRGLVHPVNVQYKVLAENRATSTSLVEIATSSVVYHFVRIYASSRISPILGDILYGSRMHTIMGVPIKTHIKQSQAFDMQPLPHRMSDALDLPKGMHGHTMIPTMLHLHRIFLPSFYGADVDIIAPPSIHFQWTAERLNLM